LVYIYLFQRTLVSLEIYRGVRYFEWPDFVLLSLFTLVIFAMWWAHAAHKAREAKVRAEMYAAMNEPTETSWPLGLRRPVNAEADRDDKVGERVDQPGGLAGIVLRHRGIHF
jgi:hypothetical protein